MAGKLLITLLVIAIAIALLRQRGREASGAARSGGAAKQDTGLSDLRLGAYLFLTLTIALGGVLYYLRWQDDHQELTVSLYREGLSAPVVYTVYKYQLQSRSFVTTDGVRITVADTERMEVTGLD
ncbi:MAG: hypothetical protein RLZZ385_2215 [Pseudomonadota bacterium]|jgi:hypothetical protein